VLANRLTEDRNNRVLLLEAGPPEQKIDCGINIPAGFTKTAEQSHLQLEFATEPEPNAQ